MRVREASVVVDGMYYVIVDISNSQVLISTFYTPDAAGSTQAVALVERWEGRPLGKATKQRAGHPCHERPLEIACSLESNGS